MAQHTLDWQETFPDVCRGGAVAVGNFDGVHRGHAALIAELCRQARELRGPAVALTFDPHPLELLRPGQSKPPLTTTADRVRAMTRNPRADFIKVVPEGQQVDPSISTE